MFILCFQSLLPGNVQDYSSQMVILLSFHTSLQKSCQSSFSLMICLSVSLHMSSLSLSAVLQHILHLQILLTFTCALLGFSEMFHKWLFDFPKVLVNLIGLGRMMLASLNLIKTGTVHWISQALNMNLLKMARCCSVLTLVRKIKKGELGSMINWDSHLVDYYLTLWSYISKSLWAFNSSLQSFLIAQSVKNLPAR